jgi:hypothetical protein
VHTARRCHEKWREVAIADPQRMPILHQLERVVEGKLVIQLKAIS